MYIYAYIYILESPHLGVGFGRDVVYHLVGVACLVDVGVILEDLWTYGGKM